MANEGSSLLDSTAKAIDEVTVFPFGIVSEIVSADHIWYLMVIQVVKLAECEIYSYNPDAEDDPLLEKGAM